jgi:hypothetical protein
MSENVLISLPDQFNDALKQSGKVAGPVAFIGGFIADVLQPLAPFSKYLFLLSFILTVGFVVLSVLRSHGRRWAFQPRCFHCLWG